MPQFPSSTRATLWRVVRSKTAIAIFVLIVAAALVYFFFFRKTTVYQFVTVAKGDISETVSLSGNTIPTQSVSLSFGGSGVVTWVGTALGKEVRDGQVLARIDSSDLWGELTKARAALIAQEAQVTQGEASVDSAKAKLEGLRNGSRPEDIAVSLAARDKSAQDLANIYSSIGDISSDAYAKANDAVRTQLQQFFTNSETINPTLAYSTSDAKKQIIAEGSRLPASIALNAWQGELLRSAGLSDVALESYVARELGYVTTIRELLSNVSATLDTTTSLSATQLSAYKSNVSLAQSGVNTATKNLNTVLQNIASQKLSLAQFSSQLALLAAGTSPTDLSSQEAQVAVAEANVLGLKALVLQGKANVGSVEAKYVHTEIVAPISGTITQFDAKVGEEAAQSVPLVSIMSTGGYEVDSGVSETDLGKIAVGNFATMTIDAFPGETFPGKVFYIAPAETNTLGVVSYQVKISFAHADPRMKSGLSTTITIETKHKDNVLILPQYAILQNDKGTFVETLLSGVVKENPVTLGISDQSGHVEIETGVSEGEVVLNIGLKTP